MHKHLATLAVLFGLMTTTGLAVDIPPSGSAVADLAVLPGGDWQKADIAGAAGDVTSVATMDAKVASPGPGTFSVMPAAGAYSNGCNAAYYKGTLYSTPASVAASCIRVAVTNKSGATATGLTINYTLCVPFNNSGVAESPRGYVVYYTTNATGTTGWVDIGNHYPPADTLGSTTNLTFTISPPGGWANGKPIYVMWADDNASGNDVCYAITNVTFAATFPSFTAYNDCVYSAAADDLNNAANVTRYSLAGSYAATGQLTNQTDGAATPVVVTLVANNGTPSFSTSGGTNCLAGTDAAALFGGKAGLRGTEGLPAGVVSASVDLIFTNLNPAKAYTFATTANRGCTIPDGGTVASWATDRWTKFTLSGATWCTNASSTGANVITNTPTNSAVSFSTGENTFNGYVARWGGIRAASNGTFKVRAENEGLNSHSNVACYGFSAFLLKEDPYALSASLIAPTNGTTLVEGSSIGMQAAVAGSVTNVAFFVNGAKLGDVATAPYTLNWTNLVAGTYAVRVVASDVVGAAVTSATVTVTVTVAPGLGGLLFNGVNQSVNFGPATATLGASNFTLECWFRRTGTGVVAYTGTGGIYAIPLITKGMHESDGSTVDCNYFLGIDTNKGVLAADFEEGATGTTPGLNHPVYGVTVVPSNVWQHAAVTYDGATWRLYLNGNLETNLFVGQPPRWDSIQYAGLAVAMNSSGGTEGAFQGVISEPRIWNYARSQAQVQATLTTAVLSASGLLGRWGLREGSGSVATNSAAGSANGTLVNGPAWCLGKALATGANAAPAVSISSPTNGATVASGADLTIAATASDDGSVAGVEFRHDGVSLGVATTAPYSVVWSAVPAGSYALTAVATDDTGLKTTSTIVNITAITPNLPPSVTAVIAPANGATGVTSAPALDITVADPEGGPVTVTFYGRVAGTGVTASNFTVVAIPDTQFYAANMNGATIDTFVAQTAWVVSNRVARNIAYVAHEGDVVQDNDTDQWEWQNAASALYRLEDPVATGLPDGIPYGICPGNHDQPGVYFNQYFGTNHFAGRAYYGGNYGANNNNHYNLFSVAGYDFIVVDLEYNGAALDASLLGWANNLLRTYAGRRAIVVTHWNVNAGNPATFSAAGQSIYDALKTNANLFLTLGGHVNPNGQGQRQDTFNGNTVCSLMADYQDWANGGSGYLRLLTFQPSNNTIQVQTYSPTLGTYQTGADHQFTLGYSLQATAGFTTLGTFTVPSGGHVTTAWTNLVSGATYQWYATVSDGTNAVSGTTNQFTVAGAGTNTSGSTLSVVLTSPANGATVGTNVAIQASASYSAGSVTGVCFYADGARLGQAAGAPYTWAWNGASVGRHTLTAVAWCDGGFAATSAVENVTVVVASDSAAFTGAYSQSFDLALANSATALPPGFQALGLAGDHFAFTNGAPIDTIAIAGATTGAVALTVWNVGGAVAKAGSTLFNVGCWDSLNNRALGTDPTGNAGTVIQLSLTNNTGGPLSGVVFSYDELVLTNGSTSNGSYTNDGTERLELPGYAFFYSLTGESVASNWYRVDALALSNAVQGTVSSSGPVTILFPAPLPNNGVMSFRWADDNCIASSPDQMIAIDNIAMTAWNGTNASRPQVSLTSPGNNANVSLGVSIMLAANAYENDGAITNVAFYAGTLLLGNVPSTPYSLTWSNAAIGSYALTAVASDARGVSTTSTVIAITVNTPVNPPPPGINPASWKFGVISDTQWSVGDDGRNPNTVAANIIQQADSQFIAAGVKFVVAVGDTMDSSSKVSMDTRALFAQDLYNAGIGFYPLRGNHDAGWTGSGAEEARVYPQIVNGGTNNMTPPDVRASGYGHDSLIDAATPAGAPFAAGGNFSYPGSVNSANGGLSYSLDFGNARFILIDQFENSDPGGTTSSVAQQQPWIAQQLADAGRPPHAFVFDHKNLLGGNHKDNLFGTHSGSDPGDADASQWPEQNAFIGTLCTNKVHFYISGHDHHHYNSIVASPDQQSRVHQLICASDSSKFYTPGTPVSTNDQPVEQDLDRIGYYIFTVDGPRVTLDYYANTTVGDYGGPFHFVKRSTAGYSLNGREFVVAEGAAYSNVTDNTAQAIASGETGYRGTTLQLLGGTNGSTAVTNYGKKGAKAVNTGWSPATNGLACDVVTLWGLSDVGATQTDSYAISMSYDPTVTTPAAIQAGGFGLVTRAASASNWVNAADLNVGGTSSGMLGPWNNGCALGSCGVDTNTHTAWAVVNHAGDFSVGSLAHGVLPPGAPSTPSPVDGVFGVATNTALAWSAINATGYQVSLWPTGGATNAASVAGATWSPGVLQAGTTYGWQVTATNDAGATPGPVWSFTTTMPLPVTVVVTNRPYVGIRLLDRTTTSPRPNRIHVADIDLNTPGLRFRLTPHAGRLDTITKPTLQFLAEQKAQLAMNANFFTPWPMTNADSAADLVGIAASDGDVFSPFEGNPPSPQAIHTNAPGLNIDPNNHATIVHRGATASSVAEPVTLWNTLSGSEQIVSNGTLIAVDNAWNNTLNPRTAIAIAPGNHLLLVTVDGRQSGVSEGLTVAELASMLIGDYQALEALNLDGGGSTTMAIDQPSPHIVNTPSDSPARSVGSSLAVFAVSTNWMASYGLTNYDTDYRRIAASGGAPVWQAYWMSVSPTNAADVLRIVAVSNAVHGAAISFPAASGRVYTLQSCDDLAGGAWATVNGQTRVPGTGGTLRLSDSGSTATSRFYRVTVDLP